MEVAARGVKFKFSTNEKVLCYEPDPTKAKVLYESKVLDLVVNRDERGRKVPAYRIHFFGWNSSWDRCVGEEFILPFTEENRILQTKLAEDAALTIKGKRKSKLPPLIKETLNKKLSMDNANNKPVQPEEPDSSSDDDSLEDETEREVHLNIPDELKAQLEKDQWLITKCNKLVKLPCEPNVVTILERFVKYLAGKLLCASPPRNSKNGKQLMPEDVKNKLNLCKEAVDGIRVYFNFTLPYLLLYHQEIKQLQQQEFYPHLKSPITNSIREPEDRKKAPHIKEEGINTNSAAPDSNFPSLTNKTEPYVPRVGRPPRGRPSHKGRGRPSKRDGRAKNGSNLKTKILLRSGRRSSKMLKATSTRVLRSRDKQKPPDKEPLPEKPNVPETKPSTSTLPEPPDSKDAICPMETRGTRKSLSMSPSSAHDSSGEKSSIHVEVKCEPGTATLSAATSNCITSSNSSGHSTLSDSKTDQQYHLINNAALLQDILNWRLLPQAYCQERPAAPSLIYGAEHLLRLFVKLPELISKMSISSHKLQHLISILEQILVYLTEKKDQLFLPSAYVDYCDAITPENSTV